MLDVGCLLEALWKEKIISWNWSCTSGGPFNCCAHANLKDACHVLLPKHNVIGRTLKTSKKQNAKQKNKNCAPVSHLLSELFEVGFSVFPSMQPKTMQPVSNETRNISSSSHILKSLQNPPCDSWLFGNKKGCNTNIAKKLVKVCCFESNAMTSLPFSNIKILTKLHHQAPGCHFSIPRNPGIHTFPSRFLPIGDSYFVTLRKKGLGHGWSKRSLKMTGYTPLLFSSPKFIPVFNWICICG